MVAELTRIGRSAHHPSLMEPVLCLRSAALLVPYKRTGHPLPFACHHSSHLASVGRIRFPRLVLPRHRRSVSCSGTAPPPLPPKNGDENRKKDRAESGRKAAKVAAISAAVALALALGAVYSRRRAPVPALLARAVNIAACQLENQPQNTEQEKSLMRMTSDAVRVILFKDASSLIETETKTSTSSGKYRFSAPERYDIAISMTLIFIAKKDFRSAKTVISQAIDKQASIKSDARPHLLMAVIDMMLAVEATLRLDNSKEVNALIDSSKESINNLFEVLTVYGVDSPDDTPDASENSVRNQAKQQREKHVK